MSNVDEEITKLRWHERVLLASGEALTDRVLALEDQIQAERALADDLADVLDSLGDGRESVNRVLARHREARGRQVVEYPEVEQWYAEHPNMSPRETRRR